jgi:hypothetical protein
MFSWLESVSPIKTTSRIPNTLDLSIPFFLLYITLPIKTPATINPKMSGETMIRQMNPSLRKIALATIAISPFNADQLRYLEVFNCKSRQ